MNRYRMFFALIAILAVASLACGALGSAPTQAPSNNSNPPKPPSDNNNTGNNNNNNNNNNTNTGGSGLVTFTDENKLAAFDLPGDWTYEHSKGDVYYVDTFTSPDGSAKMENMVYNDGTAFTGSQNGQFALYLLNTFYSNTGKEGDIRVTSDQIMQDGSERLQWSSKGGGYSGVSFFEIRGGDRKTFMMLTAWWSNSADQSVIDAINNAIASYRIP